MPELEAALLDVTSWVKLGQEWDGKSDHFWLSDPESGWPWLWKPAQGRRFDRQEHLAELVVSRLAAAMSVPCAEIRLAERIGVVGCLSRDVKERDVTLEPGEWLLNAFDSDFNARLREPDLHSVPMLVQVLTGVGPPPTWTGPNQFSGLDVMAGYLCLDALVLNRDRHAANWAVLRPKHGRGKASLAPLYDNASALGFALSDTNKRKKLESRGVAAYVSREDWARSFARHNGQTDSLVRVAAAAAAACSREVREYWKRQVRLADRDLLLEAADVPGLSAVSRTFAVELVLAQRDRILEAVSHV